MRSLVFACLGVFALVLAACSGSQQIYTPLPTPSSQTMGTVSFLVIVPSSQTAVKHRNIVVPSNAQSVTFTLVSVNGTAYSGTPTTVNLSSATSGCTVTSAQLSCVVNVTVPAGTLVFSISTFTGASGGGTLIATGNLSVTSTAGQTVIAPTTVGGTLAKIVVTVTGAAELGSSVSIPVTVQGEDSNGDTILGTYSSSITLTDTDASGQTSIAPTSVPDSTTAATVVLKYLGGSMSTAATIGASASGVSASSVTSGTFSPDQTNPTVNGNTVTFDTVYQDGYADDSVQPTPGPTSSSNYSYTYATGQTFNGISNAIDIQNDYYVWTPNGASSTLGYLGWSDGSDEQDLCASPYYAEFVIPVPSSWNAYQGTGACTYSYSYDYGGTTPPETDTETQINNADGSYTATEAWNYTACCTNDYGSEDYTLASSGAGTLIDSEGSGSNAVSIAAPVAGSSTLSASYVTYPSGTFPPSATPTPTTTTAPNPFLAIGLSSGAPALLSDVYTSKGTIASLPANCNVSSSILGTNPQLTEIDETYSSADPLDYDWLYDTQTTQHYYLSGVGEVCFSYDWTAYYYDDGPLQWYNGSDQYWDACSDVETDSLSATSLQAAIKKRNLSAAGSIPVSVILDAAARSRIHTLQRAHEAKARARVMQRRKEAASRH